MKIFYKKDFQRVLEEKNKIEEEYQVYKEKSEKAITELNIKNSSQLKEITDLGNQIIDKNSVIKRYTILQTEISEENSKLKSKLIHANTSKGGLTKEINKLRGKVNSLAEEIKEKNKLLSERFILRELKPGRTPNMNKTKISKPMSNNVRNFMKREFDNV